MTMKYTLIFKTVIFLSLLMTSSPALSAPNITSIDDTTLTHGQSNVSISCTGAGTGGGAPYKFDDFEDGTVGNEVGGGWYTYGVPSDEVGATYSTAEIRGESNRVAHQDYSDNYGEMFGVTGWDTTKYYVSFWWYFESTSESDSRNFKVLGMRSPSEAPCDVSSELCSPEMRWDLYPVNGSGHHYFDGLSTLILNSWGSGNTGGAVGPVTINTDVQSNTLQEDKWQRIELWIDQGTYGNNDGESVMVWHHDGAISTNWDFSGMPLNSTNIPSTALDGVYLTRYYAIDTYSPAPSANVYIDEVYLAETRSRVEIGDADTWSNCTHREIQIPTSWSDTSVTFTVNQGALDDGTAYLFVVDENGDASAGEMITLGETTATPATIQRATIQRGIFVGGD